jgi:Spy/CpxP family protein refolding chaperone
MNMKKIRILRIVAAVFMVLLFSGASMAGMPGMGPGGVPLKVLMELDLTETQKAEIAAILEESKVEMDSAKEKHKEVKNIMSPVMEADSFNEENLRAAFAKATPIMEEILVTKARITSQIKGVLTDAQKQILSDKRQERMEKREKFGEFQETMLETWLTRNPSQ